MFGAAVGLQVYMPDKQAFLSVPKIWQMECYSKTFVVQFLYACANHLIRLHYIVNS